MSAYFFPIKTSLIVFLVLCLFLTVPWLIYNYRKFGYFNFWNFFIVYSFSLYVLTAFFLVILPLPASRDTCAFQSPGTRHYSLVPFAFIKDIFNSPTFNWKIPSTYIQTVKESAFLQAFFNFLLLMPLGFYIRSFFPEKKNWKKALGFGFALSLFFEITQITGIYGIYNCPYRIFDVDDLFLNSTGALTGFLLAPILLSLFPSKEKVELKIKRVQKSLLVAPVAQLLSLLIDYYAITLVWTLVISRFIPVFKPFFILTGFIITFIIVPSKWEGKTLGTAFMKYKLTQWDGTPPSVRALSKRTFALFLPWVLSEFLRFLSSIQLPIGHPFYAFHAWFTVSVLALWIIMWVVLGLHALVVIWGKGKRTFYFDHYAGIVPQKRNKR